MTTPILNSAELVNAGWAQFSETADSGFAVGLGIANRLSQFEIDPVNYDTSFQVVDGVLQGFQAPPRPDSPDFDFEVEIPEALAINTIAIPDFGDAPSFDVDRPTLDFGSQPDPLNVTPPPDPPTFIEPSIPDEPVITLPDPPSLLALDLPEPPDLIEIEFEGQRPDLDLPEPDSAINFVEEDYTGTLLPKLTTEIQRMLDTGSGMPAHVEQLLVDRGRERISSEATRSIQQATEEWSARGFTLPPGSLTSRLNQIRQDAQNQANAFSRDVFIQRRQEELENFRFAIAQGIALENILVQIHLAAQERAFRLALETANLEFRLLEARVAIFNAQLAAYQTDAEVFRQRLQAELVKLEQFRAEIQAEALKEEINQTRVARYNAQIQAVREIVNVYRSRVEAVRALADVNNARANAYASQVNGYRALIEAKTEEYNAWRTRIQGELGKVAAYEAETRAYVARVQGYEAGVRGKAVGPQIEAQVEDTRIRQYIARLDAVQTEISAEQARLQARASAFSSQASMYAAAGQIAASSADANTRQFLALVEQNRTKAEQALASAQLDVEQVLRSGTIISGALDSAGRIASQIGAGAAAAVNLGARISGSESWNYNISSTA